MRAHRSELDQQVQVAFAGPEVVAQGRAEHVQARNVIAPAEALDGPAVVFKQANHDLSPLNG